MIKRGEWHLRTPGPTPVPKRVQQAMMQPMVDHRSPQFSQLFLETSHRLRPIFGTKQDVLIITGSGTSALEAAVVNLTQPDDDVAVVVTGAFGERFAEICSTYGRRVHRLDIPWGQAASPLQLRTFLRERSPLAAVFMTHCETSTGVLNPIAEMAAVVRDESEALVIVDAVSSAGGTPLHMDQWGVDMIVSGSQKALMCPPGLAFVTASERAYEKMRQLKQKPFYLNLLNYKEEAAKGTTPATPAVSLIYGLQEALNIIEEEGLNQVFERHMWLKKMTRAAVTAAGLPLLTTEEDASPTVTAITETPSFQPEAFRKTARETYGLILAGGQKKLKGRLVRFGHMGACSFFELIQSLFLFEMTLRATGHPVPPGTMVQAAEEVLS